ncbi:hypothetical protein FAGAP_6288 [Fusarium agapanthi]|uniref:AttH domain-containing protein n=1 Tax=Fusarium agapanthi TaxID=1803897 RepID=A0A9P5EE54_9HYPO|nr:hypothetical protein FAGAP_6288 [Fusarium agapanthi]
MEDWAGLKQTNISGRSSARFAGCTRVRSTRKLRNDTTSRTESAQGRLLTDSQSLQKLGLDSSKPATWEDGLRSPGVESGEWEWWYADAHLQDGWFLQVAFCYMTEGDDPNTGLIDLNIAKDGKKLFDLHKRIGTLPSDIVVGKGHCDLQYRKSYFRSVNGLSEYHIFVDPDEMEGFGFDVVIKRTTPSYRPGSGRWDVDGRHFSWFVAVPGGHLTGEVTANGIKTKVEDNAYHDHNWGNVPMEKILDNWLWGRADVSELSIVSASVRFRQDCGGREVPLLFVVRGNEVLLDVSDDQLVCLEGVKIKGKPISSDCIYLVKSAGNNLAQVRFDGQQKMIASFPYPTTSQEWETRYTRYAGMVTINIADGDKQVHVSDHGSLEVMDFFGRRKA